MNEITTIYLEMVDRSQLCPKQVTDSRFQVLEASVDQWQFNRFLYILVGGPWAWRDKLSWSDARWKAYVESEATRTFVGYWDGSPAGYFELQVQDGDVEIAYFGLAPSFIGKGLGGVLLTRTLEEAWALNPRRVWVHTCTLDHPAALKNYQSRGMVIYKTETHDGISE
ncbi:MAG: GNAT family N-acetyltransferase [Desulforhopalus sp.]|nr:GNAT family N-acetyltransferase [Desulforhopalus sp.]